MNDNIIRAALVHYGIESQMNKAIEECAELVSALQHNRAGRCDDNDVVCEIADVMIMCQQLAIFYGQDKVEQAIDFKLQRLEKRINDRDNATYN